MTFREAMEEERYCAQVLLNIAISLSSLRLLMGLLVLFAMPNALLTVCSSHQSEAGSRSG